MVARADVFASVPACMRCDRCQRLASPQQPPL